MNELKGLPVIATGREIDNHVELEITEGPFQDITFYYEGMKFAEKENEDGSLNLAFDYKITGEVPKKLNRFEHYIGDLLLQILEAQIKNNEAIYTGGTDESIGGNNGTAA